MEDIKLTYFNIMGLGEPIRFMLSYMGKEFKDFRMENFQVWQSEYKSKMPFGKLPLLEIGNKKLHQTQAICRYLGKQVHLAGDNDWEALQIDTVMDVFTDFRHDVWKFFYNRDEVHREKLRGPLMTHTAPFYLEKFDTMIAEGNGYLANEKLSWADIYYVATLGYFSFMLEMDICDKYPNINALRNKVHRLPGIKLWVEHRPQTKW